MNELLIFGTCSGTEPMPGRTHTSFAVHAGDRYYFFDAGECCSRTATFMGVDTFKIRAVFISHTHYDHMGGLAGLFWTIRKNCVMKKKETADGTVRLFIPKPEAWDGILQMLRCSEGNFSSRFDVEVNKTESGIIFEDENIRVRAVQNRHLADGSSYSFRVRVGNKVIVFSGDVHDMEDLGHTVGDGCDILLCETGHHTVADVCRFAENAHVGRLFFVHHGREILENRPSVAETLAACRIPVTVTNDATTVML